jgi:hypothetical protein
MLFTSVNETSVDINVWNNELSTILCELSAILDQLSASLKVVSVSDEHERKVREEWRKVSFVSCGRAVKLSLLYFINFIARLANFRNTLFPGRQAKRQNDLFKRRPAISDVRHIQICLTGCQTNLSDRQICLSDKFV